MFRRRNVGQLFLFSFVAAAWGCSSDDLIDTNRPASFYDNCTASSATCKGPFMCLPNPALGGNSFCTSPCTTDSDCPKWTATGHCPGPVQSACDGGVCQPHQCE